MVDCSKQLTIGTRNPETKIRINIHTYIHTYMCIGRILHTNTGGRNIGQTLFLVSAAALSLYTVMEPSEFTYLFPSTSCEDAGNSLNGADLIWIFIIFNVASQHTHICTHLRLCVCACVRACVRACVCFCYVCVRMCYGQVCGHSPLFCTHVTLVSCMCVCVSLCVCIVIDHEVAHIASSYTEHAVLVNHVMMCRMCSNSVPWHCVGVSRCLFNVLPFEI